MHFVHPSLVLEKVTDTKELKRLEAKQYKRIEKRLQLYKVSLMIQYQFSQSPFRNRQGSRAISKRQKKRYLSMALLTSCQLQAIIATDAMRCDDDDDEAEVDEDDDDEDD